MEKLLFNLENFEGPLDILLTLIAKNKMNIYDIKIAVILEQYLEQIEKMEKADLYITAEFLTMASQLVYIKSKMLLPKEDEEQEEDPREALVMMLLEYKRYKEVSTKFTKVTFGLNNIFVKEQDVVEFDKDYKKTHNIEELTESYRNMLRRIKRKLPPEQNSFSGIVGRTIVSVSSKAVSLIKRLLKFKRISFKDLFSDAKSRSEIVATFLAVLELSKNSKIEITGDSNEPILSVKRK